MTKPENQFLCGLIHRMSIPGYWFPRRIKLQKISDFPDFYPKTPPKWAWIGIFRLNAQNIKTCLLSKLLHRFKPNFAQWQTTKIHFVGGPNRRITNPRWRTAAILKNRKRPYLRNGSTKLHKIWHRDSPPTSALKSGATHYRLIPKCLIWNDTKWHKCR